VLHLGWSASSGGKPMSSLVVVGAGADAGSECESARKNLRRAAKQESRAAENAEPNSHAPGQQVTEDPDAGESAPPTALLGPRGQPMTPVHSVSSEEAQPHTSARRSSSSRPRRSRLD